MKTLIFILVVAGLMAGLIGSDALAKTAYPEVSDLTGETVFRGRAGAGSPHVALPGKGMKTPGIYVEYSPATKPVLKTLRKRFMEHKVLERLFAGVNDSFKFKTATTFQMAECGYTGAFQNTRERRMVICYEFVLLLKIAFEKGGAPVKSLDKAVFHAFVGVAWHEFGHFLLGEFDILVTGSAEDAVDQLSAIIQIARDPVPVPDPVSGPAAVAALPAALPVALPVGRTAS